MTTLVIDSSIIIKWLSQDNEECLEEANKILQDEQSGKITLIAPELAKYEVGNVLLFSKHLTSEQAEIVLSQFYKLPITFIVESETLAKETFKIAFDLMVTYYDASFMSLAKQHDATLVTDNLKHQGKDANIKVVALRDY
ncbi:MAG: hypothetical protein A3D26_00065 [Candidatus Blackburnbacteria bacterium RIFCSPHIGHO2_02_FULL_44_20]|uniref:PIN domain-containing protein n=1 Tax=Candidatus Blackburnbacteria bacterium RIFCSPHIGHO2_02_FULL_44_20 TaxID=1797516 RepID=A0A1G1VAD2_9BACT|nr:MAG: hypothetical protein A3D26_00065 [Candidatus Blackburnbacteria bacterium RIFCSPHIGHO2_02_FULL_44_20]